MKRFFLAAFVVAFVAACSDPVTPPEPSPPEFARGAGAAVDVIVVLKTAFAPGAHEANRARATEIARALGASPRHSYGTALFGFSATIPEERLAALRADPRVAYVDRDGVVSIPEPLAPAGPPGGSTGEIVPWGIKRIGADANTNEASGIHVYILDTGIDSDHPDLVGRIGNGFAVETCNGGPNMCKEPWDDDHDHGTHVAGTVAANDNDIDVIGVATQVTLHSVKVLGPGGFGSFSGVAAGIDWVANETQTLGTPTVANMSLGGSGSKTGTCTSSGFTGTDAVHQALCNATNVGVIFAVAAGNDGADAEGFVPAAYDDAVITVSATQCTRSVPQTCDAGTDDWPDWSNWGDNAASWTPHASAPVAIAAPGVSVLSLKRGGGTTTFSGTSMATPHTAGAIALYLKSARRVRASYSAFSNARAALLDADESTDTWTNTSGNVHNEDFLSARSF